MLISISAVSILPPGNINTDYIYNIIQYCKILYNIIQYNSNTALKITEGTEKILRRSDSSRECGSRYRMNL